MQLAKNFSKGKKHINISNKGVLSREEINNSSFDTGWRNNMAGIVSRLESEEYITSGDSLINIAKIIQEEAELNQSVLSSYRGDIKIIEDGAEKIIKDVDPATVRDLEAYLPIKAMADMSGNLKRSGLDRQMIDGLVAAKVLYKVVSELEEMKKIILQGYEAGHLTDELAKEIGMFGFGVIEDEAPKTTLISKNGGKFNRNQEETTSAFGNKGFNRDKPTSGGGLFERHLGGNSFGGGGRGFGGSSLGGGRNTGFTFKNAGGSLGGKSLGGSAFSKIGAGSLGGGNTFKKKTGFTR